MWVREELFALGNPVTAGSVFIIIILISFFLLRWRQTKSTPAIIFTQGKDTTAIADEGKIDGFFDDDLSLPAQEKNRSSSFNQPVDGTMEAFFHCATTTGINVNKIKGKEIQNRIISITRKAEFCIHKHVNRSLTKPSLSRPYIKIPLKDLTSCFVITDSDVPTFLIGFKNKNYIFTHSNKDRVQIIVNGFQHIIHGIKKQKDYLTNFSSMLIGYITSFESRNRYCICDKNKTAIEAEEVEFIQK
jgi:hypothetical protein